MAIDSQSLEYTPTWVVALVCSVIVIISLTAERLLHYLGEVSCFSDLEAQETRRSYEALQKLKEELMLLGFISLLLTVFQSSINQICIPTALSMHMLPCKREESSDTETLKGIHHHLDFHPGVRWNGRRLLSTGTGSEECTRKGKVPLLSVEGLHQLHIFIFVLALVHVIFCATTMVLAGAKIQLWKKWENSIRNEITNLGKTENTAHAHRPHIHLQFITDRAMGFWTNSAIVSWILSFFKQFYGSFTKSDYAAIRSGFIMTHCRSNPTFDFHTYMMRALKSDFKKVVGISWYLWLFVVIFLFLNVNGWNAYFWLSFLPLILLLLVGAKLEYIITRLAQEVSQKLQENSPDARVNPSDDLFWFHRPDIVLYLIHFILFQNSFEIAFFFWILSTYGFRSCIMGKLGYVIPRLVIGVIVQVLCSYSTLPLYAVVTQMGSNFKRAIFDDQIQETLQGWVKETRRKRRSVAASLRPWKKFGKLKEESNSSQSVSTWKMDVEAFGRNHMQITQA